MLKDEGEREIAERGATPISLLHGKEQASKALKELLVYHLLDGGVGRDGGVVGLGRLRRVAGLLGLAGVAGTLVGSGSRTRPGSQAPLAPT